MILGLVFLWCALLFIKASNPDIIDDDRLDEYLRGNHCMPMPSDMSEERDPEAATDLLLSAVGQNRPVGGG